MTTILFSIIVPVYNVGHWLTPCLESIQHQSFPNWEAILIDDGSTDSSGVICDKYASQDKRFKVIHQSNQGVAAARNTGMKMASGSWVWCIDSDDVINLKAFEIYNILINNNPDCDVFIHDFLKEAIIAFPDIYLSSADKTISIMDNYPEMSAWRCIFKKRFAEEVFFHPFVVGEDLLFCAELLSKAKHVAHVALPLYGYVMRDSSVTHTPTLKTVHDSIQWHGKILELYSNEESKCFFQVEKIRWNLFLFMLPLRISKYKGDNKTTLYILWYETLQQIPLNHLSKIKNRLVRLMLAIYHKNKRIGFVALDSLAIVYRAYYLMKKKTL